MNLRLVAALSISMFVSEIHADIASSPHLSTKERRADGETTALRLAQEKVATKSTDKATASPRRGERRGEVIVVQLRPSQGLLAELLRKEVAKAEGVGRTSFLELTRSQCAPCDALHAFLSDPLMVDAFEDVYLIRLDVDEWRNHLAPRGYYTSGLPRFYRLGLAEDFGGASIASDAWGQSVPEQMAPPLRDFFRSNLIKKKGRN